MKEQKRIIAFAWQRHYPYVDNIVGIYDSVEELERAFKIRDDEYPGRYKRNAKEYSDYNYVAYIDLNKRLVSKEKKKTRYQDEGLTYLFGTD